eukprot:109033_1
MALTVLRVLGFIGLWLCAYALYIEYKISVDPDYVASCDLASWISCSKVFSSKYAHMFYFPNAAYGAVFYVVILVMDTMKLYQYIMYLSTLTFLSSLYLAYILAFVLKDMCVVCVSTYIVNAAIFFVSKHYVNTAKKTTKKKT